jgi:hypothetical protein
MYRLRLLSEDDHSFDAIWPEEPPGVQFDLHLLSDGSFLTCGINSTPSPLEPHDVRKEISRGLMFTRISPDGQIAWQAVIPWHDMDCEPIGLLQMVYCTEASARPDLEDVQELESGELRVFVTSVRGVIEVMLSDAGEVLSTAYHHTDIGWRELVVDESGRALLVHIHLKDKYVGVRSIGPSGTSEYLIELPTKDPNMEAMPISHDKIFLAYSDKKSAVIRIVEVGEMTPAGK